MLFFFTVHSFVEVAKFLLSSNKDDLFLLSERFSQDPLENYFGQQRARGGRRRLFDDKDQETIVAEASSLPLPKRSRNRSANKLKKKKKRKKDKHHDNYVCVLFSHQFLQCPF